MAEWQGGQNVLFYGPVSHASSEMRIALGVDLTNPIEGVLAFESTLPVDRYRHGADAARIQHPALTSAGGVDTVARDIEVCVTVRQGGER